MSGIARSEIDFSSTHSNEDTHTAPGQTKYIGTSNVYVNGKRAIVKGDKTQCGDTVKEGSSKVFIQGQSVHRLGDLMDSHGGSYSQSVCISASGNVYAA